MEDYILRQRTFLGNSKDYYHSCVEDFETIRTYLDGRFIRSFLDIGCGLAGPSVLISKYLNDPWTFLLDKEDNNQLRYGYENHDAFYNKQYLTEQFFRLNGHPHFKYLDGLDPLTGFMPVDLIVSFYSWGWHYPIGTYIEQVNDITKRGSLIITDIRVTTKGEACFKGFSQIGYINVNSQGYKGNRFIFEKL